VIVALGLRVGEVERTASYRPMNDGQSYLTLAREIAQTGDYAISHAPGSGAGGSTGPTAYFAPAYPYFLAAVDLIDGDTTRGGRAVHAARLATAVLGAGAVALIGLVALEAFGESTALVAMLIAALYPPLIELSGTPYSENLLIVLELAAVWAALRARRAENPFPWLGAAGALTGLAALTHQNGIVILLPLIFCAIAAGRRWAGVGAAQGRSDPAPQGHDGTPPGRDAKGPTFLRRAWFRTLAAPLLLVAVTALTIAPWTVRNAVLLHRFVPISDETGITLAGTYNSTSAANREIPYKWTWYGVVPAYKPIARRSLGMTEPALSDRLTSAAFHYIGDHPLSPLQVAYHNLRRLLELEGTAAWHDSTASIGLSEGTARIGVYGFWVVAALAAMGLFTRRARKAPEWLWVIPILLAWSVLLVNSETPRFRSPVDPYLIMLAACAIVSIGARLAPHLRRPRFGAPLPA
jgi:hypothetical protein